MLLLHFLNIYKGVQFKYFFKCIQRIPHQDLQWNKFTILN